MRAPCFPGHRYLLLSVIVLPLFPTTVMHLLVLRVRRAFKLRPGLLCRSHYRPLPRFHRQRTCSFWLSFFFFFFTTYFMHHMSFLAAMPTTAQGAGSRVKEEEAVAEIKKKKNTRRGLFLFFVYIPPFLKANPKEALMPELPPKHSVLMNLTSQANGRVPAPCASERRFLFLLHNGESEVIFRRNDRRCRRKTARSVCPEERPNQQLLITGEQAQGAFHLPGIQLGAERVNQPQHTWKTCHSSNICGHV